jgi:hypothetical protein
MIFLSHQFRNSQYWNCAFILFDSLQSFAATSGKFSAADMILARAVDFFNSNWSNSVNLFQ